MLALPKHSMACIGQCSSSYSSSSSRPVARRHHAAGRATRPRTRAGADDMQQAIKEAMKDPKMAAQIKAAQEAFARPEAQEQLRQMQAMMQNQQLQQRMQEMRNDPEMADFWADVEKGGMQAIMKYYNDPKFLEKFGEKLGDVIPGAAGGAAAGAGAPVAAPPAGLGAGGAPPAPEIKDLLDAAKYGDMEAVEDFLAIGKDVGMKDAESRTPLHFASGYDHPGIVKMLVEAGAPLEATDSKGNTPLLYAAGYGRARVVDVLLAAGADRAAKNSNGKTAYDLATADARNPLSQDQATLDKLKL